MPRYNPTPAPEFYVPDEDVVIEDVMDQVLVRYGKDPRRLRRVLSKLALLWPLSFRRVVNSRVGWRML